MNVKLADPVRILLVEPDDSDAAECTKALVQQGWIVERARAFAEAYELLCQSAYQVAIIEVILPDHLGADAWLYLHKVNPDMIGVITTSAPSLHASVNAFEPGVIAYLLKPIETNTLCNLIVHSVAHQRLLKETRRTQSQFMGLSTLMSSLTQVSAGDQIVKATLAHFQAVLTPHSVAISLLGKEKSRPGQRFVRHFAPGHKGWTRAQATLIKRLMEEAVESRQSLVIGDAPTDENGHHQIRPDEVGLGTIVVVPVIGRFETYGALAVADELQSEQSSTANVGLVTSIGQVMALALDNVFMADELREETILNKATGLHSRLYLDRLVLLERARSTRYARPFALVLMECANLAPLLENHGREALLRTMREVGCVTQRQVRSSDVVAHQTDEALAILLPETDHTRAQLVAERLTQTLESQFADRIFGEQPRIKATVLSDSEVRLP